MKYRIYIDEVGNPDLKSSHNTNHRFLSLTGVIMELGYLESVFQPNLEALKKKYFPEHHPDDPLIFHRKEMINCKNSFERLRKPEIRFQFDQELLNLLAYTDFTVITVCIDKFKHQEKYIIWRYDPYHYCLTVIIERFVFFLSRRNAVGDVLAESRGGKEDRRLKDTFERIWNNGTTQNKPDIFQRFLTSKQLKLKTKNNNIAGLQLADLIAHPSRNEILREYNYPDIRVSPFAESIIQILQPKYDQRNGKIFGKKLLP